MAIHPGFATDPGTRKDQQDSSGFTRFNDKRFVANFGVMAVVADGMGGLEGGQQASYHAAQAMLEAYEKRGPGESMPDALLRALDQANKRVQEKGSRMGADEIGTTLVSAVIHKQDLYWISVGDSRAYLFRNGELTLLTCDHNREMELLEEVAAGTRDLQDARNDPEREGLVSFLGQSQVGRVDRNIRPWPLQLNDRVLLCTDGLYRTVPEHTIARLLDDPDPQSAAEHLVQAALSARLPHQDNVTVAILAVTPSALEIVRKYLSRLTLTPRFAVAMGGVALAVLVAIATLKFFPQMRTLPPHLDAPEGPTVAVAPATEPAASSPSGTVATDSVRAVPKCKPQSQRGPADFSPDESDKLKASAKALLGKYFEALRTSDIGAARKMWIWFPPELGEMIRNYEYVLDSVAEPELFRGETNTTCAQVSIRATLKERGPKSSTSENPTYYLQRDGEDWKIARSEWR